MSNSRVTLFILLLATASTLTVNATGQGTAFVRLSQSNLRGNQDGPKAPKDKSIDNVSQDAIRLRGSADTFNTQIHFAMRHQYEKHHGDDNEANSESSNNSGNDTITASGKEPEAIEAQKPSSATAAPRMGTRMLKRDKAKKSKAAKKGKKGKHNKKNSNRTVAPTSSPSSGSSVMDSYSESIGQEARQNNIEGFVPEPVLDDSEGDILPETSDIPLDGDRSQNQEEVLPTVTPNDPKPILTNAPTFSPTSETSTSSPTQDTVGILPNPIEELPQNPFEKDRVRVLPLPDPDEDIYFHNPPAEDRVRVLPDPDDDPDDILSIITPNTKLTDTSEEKFEMTRYSAPADEDLQFQLQDSDSNNQVSDRTGNARCPGDVELLSRTGAKSVMTSDPILDAVEIIRQDTSTVTMNLYQVWDSKPGFALDFFFYHFHEPGKHFWANTKCYEKTWVPHSTSKKVDTIDIACNRSQPYAELELCLVDNISHATLFPSGPSDQNYLSQGDKSIIPRMCRHETTPTELAACYKLKIRCSPRSENETC